MVLPNTELLISRTSSKYYSEEERPKKKVIYIAGPYRADCEYQVRINIRSAERAALEVWMLGGVALCPHKNTAGLGGAHGLADEVWLEGDKELLLRCDAVYAIPGWDFSEGAEAEVEFAGENGIPVLTDRHELSKFLGFPK